MGFRSEVRLHFARSAVRRSGADSVEEDAVVLQLGLGDEHRPRRKAVPPVSPQIALAHREPGSWCPPSKVQITVSVNRQPVDQCCRADILPRGAQLKVQRLQMLNECHCVGTVASRAAGAITRGVLTLTFNVPASVPLGLAQAHGDAVSGGATSSLRSTTVDSVTT
jgi:hypothetical protein